MFRKASAAVIAAGALAVGVAGPASAQQQGLVNVELTNVLNDNQVVLTVPVNAAANICGVNVAVLANLTAPFTACEARGNQRVVVSPIN